MQCSVTDSLCVRQCDSVGMAQSVDPALRYTVKLVALLNLVAVICVKQFGVYLMVLTGVNILLFFGAGLMGARTSGTITNPKRQVAKQPPGPPAGVTYAGR